MRKVIKTVGNGLYVGLALIGLFSTLAVVKNEFISTDKLILESEAIEMAKAERIKAEKVMENNVKTISVNVRNHVKNLTLWFKTYLAVLNARLNEVAKELEKCEAKNETK